MKTTTLAPIILMWSRFGPYHRSRLQGLIDAFGGSPHSVVGLEVCSRDGYAWEEASSDTAAEYLTLFRDSDYRAISRWRIAWNTVRVLNSMHPQAVVVNGWGVAEALGGIGWCWWSNVPCILMSETMEGTREGGLRKIKESIKSLIVRHCGAALVGGIKQSEYLQKLGFPGDKIFLGYDVVDNAYFSNGSRDVRSERQAYRLALDLPETYFFVCTRLLKRKNVDGLLRAYSQYRERCAGTPWDLVICGSGEESDSLRQLAARICPMGVRWTGFLQYDQLPAYYALASAFIHPALTEAWGLVVNEAAACGLPLLVGNTVGSRYELVRDGENGFLFDASDVDDICRAMCAVSMLTEEERQEMGASSEEIVSEWSPRRFGEQLLAAVETARRERDPRISPRKRMSESR